jgi:hypothetical protein
MRSKVLSRFLLIVVACASLCAVASDVFAQTQQLDKTLVRKFPEGFCPLDTQQIGSFTSNTGIIQLTFITGLGASGLKSGDVTVGFGQILDDISIIEAADFAVNSVPDEVTFCYFDSDPHVPVYNQPLPNAHAPFYDSFGPSTSPCPWDETDGFAITGGELVYTGSGDVASTSVIISGLTPGTPYIIHGRWKAVGFPFATACDASSLCMTVQVDDLQAGCGPLPVETKTWGGVKSLYKK